MHKWYFRFSAAFWLLMMALLLRNDILPNYVVSTSPTHTVLRNFEGMLINYPEPGLTRGGPPRTGEGHVPGVWDLATGRASSLTPANLHRHQRRKGQPKPPSSAAPPPCGAE